MSYMYFLINTTNSKTYVGKTNYPKEIFKTLLYDALDDGKHYNELLQRDWFKFNFRLVFWEDEEDKIIDECDSIIKNKNLLNPIYGYNMYMDLKKKKGRFIKNEVFNDDICLTYIFFPKIQFVVRVLDLERNTVSNRLSNYELFNDAYYTKTIATYDDYFWTAIRIIFVAKQCLSASQILDKMMNRYNVSGMLRITPRKISRFFNSHEIHGKDNSKQGCLVFCPDFGVRDKYDGREEEESDN